MSNQSNDDILTSVKSAEEIRSSIVATENVLATTSIIDEAHKDHSGHSDEPEGSLYDLFGTELEDFAIFVAASDGSITADELTKINELLGSNISLELANGIASDYAEDNWEDYRSKPPVSFLFLVEMMGNAGGIKTALPVARMYFEIAKYIRSVDGHGPYSISDPTYPYISDLFLYVLTVSNNGYKPLLNEGATQVTFDDVLDPSGIAGLTRGFDLRKIYPSKHEQTPKNSTPNHSGSQPRGSLAEFKAKHETLIRIASGAGVVVLAVIVLILIVGVMHLMGINPGSRSFLGIVPIWDPDGMSIYDRISWMMGW